MSANVPHTQSQLVRDFKALGITQGQVIMVHSAVSTIGEIMGGANVIIQALLETLGTEGTLMMYVGWQDIPDFVLELPIEVRTLYYAEHPAFDPATSRAVRENSILAEFLRTFPQAHRSLNPEASMVAIGALAEDITRDHPLNYGYGEGSPLAKLVEYGGSVLMLGAPLDTITLLHHAEYLARLKYKRIVRYQCPIVRDGHKVWVEIEDYDTGEPHADYSLEEIALAYLAQRHAHHGKIGNATSFLFNANDLTNFAVSWLEERFG